ncbi:hypothetical protein BpHYR1_019256 [Brachionus plicatilis]|uniref:Uncharacterized protein n=1 Tax=Brachionus plicatilis TaxID=10195 RepID=A0A3M7PEG4_BRAPC|nr:hypothetical protein BpHYR1_019256 [Brachionus plicatilis]
MSFWLYLIYNTKESADRLRWLKLISNSIRFIALEHLCYLTEISSMDIKNEIDEKLQIFTLNVLTIYTKAFQKPKYNRADLTNCQSSQEKTVYSRLTAEQCYI